MAENFENQNQNEHRIPAERLDELVKNVETKACGESFLRYGMILENGGEQAQEFFRKLLAGKPLVDLGCGQLTPKYGTSEVENFAHNVGASKYVGVDKFRIPPNSKPHEFADGFIGEFVSEDMLKYVFNLPAESANIMGFASPFLDGLRELGFTQIQTEDANTGLVVYQKFDKEQREK